jgi:hypothetical protein
MPGCVRRARMRRSARKRCSNAGASTSHALDGDLLREMSPSHPLAEPDFTHAHRFPSRRVRRNGPKGSAWLRCVSVACWLASNWPSTRDNLSNA